MRKFFSSGSKATAKETESKDDKRSDFEIEDNGDDEKGIKMLIVMTRIKFCFCVDSAFLKSLQVNLSRLIVYAESADTKLQREVTVLVYTAIFHPNELNNCIIMGKGGGEARERSSEGLPASADRGVRGSFSADPPDPQP
jgi:hypothetical protein